MVRHHNLAKTGLQSCRQMCRREVFSCGWLGMQATPAETPSFYGTGPLPSVLVAVRQVREIPW